MLLQLFLYVENDSEYEANRESKGANADVSNRDNIEAIRCIIKSKEGMAI